jgi:ATP-dependent DNA helicase RecQ
MDMEAPAEAAPQAETARSPAPEAPGAAAARDPAATPGEAGPGAVAPGAPEAPAERAAPHEDPAAAAPRLELPLEPPRPAPTANTVTLDRSAGVLRRPARGPVDRSSAPAPAPAFAPPPSRPAAAPATVAPRHARAAVAVEPAPRPASAPPPPAAAPVSLAPPPAAPARPNGLAFPANGRALAGLPPLRADVLPLDLFHVDLLATDLALLGNMPRGLWTPPPAVAAGEPAPAPDLGLGRRRRRRRGRRRHQVVSTPSVTTDLTIVPGIDDEEEEDDPAEAERLMNQANTVLREKFGFKELTRAQTHVVRSLLLGHDVLAVLPTGSGKSLCYQLPGLLVEGITVVVSPLLALMADQEAKLKAHNLPVVRLDSTLHAAERREALARIRSGKWPLILLTTPETLGSAELRDALQGVQVGLIAIDEAHCVSEWGHDFRPAYLTLGDRIRELGEPPVLALTATAVLRVRHDIRNFLGLEDPDIVTASPDRPNLHFAVLRPGAYAAKVRELVRLVQKLPAPGIIYASTIAAVEELWLALRLAKVPACRYHGKMSPADRQQEQDRFMARTERRVMAATNAFGLGIDKPDIRYVIHYQAPGSIEQYVQEAGRAGRDGKEAHCVLLFDESDLGVQEHFIKEKYPPKRSLEQLVEALAAWAGEHRDVSAADLALAAHTRATYATSLLGELRDLGLVDETEHRRWRPAAAAQSVAQTARAAAIRYETLRIADKRRLQQVVDYAHAETCRSVYLRQYFGDPDPPKCGRCDVCTGEFADLTPAPPLKLPQRHRPKEQRRGGRKGEHRGWTHRRRGARG